METKKQNRRTQVRKVRRVLNKKIDDEAPKQMSIRIGNVANYGAGINRRSI